MRPLPGREGTSTIGLLEIKSGSLNAFSTDRYNDCAAPVSKRSSRLQAGALPCYIPLFHVGAVLRVAGRFKQELSRDAARKQAMLDAVTDSIFWSVLYDGLASRDVYAEVRLQARHYSRSHLLRLWRAAFLSVC